MWFDAGDRDNLHYSEHPIHVTVARRQMENRRERRLKDRCEKRSECKFSALISLILLLTTVIGSHAERLPIKTYTTADGLPNNTVARIVRDSHGFLWFCTLHGLARFDGYTFRNYSDEEGLPGAIFDLLETRSGEYWVAASTGLYQFHASILHPQSNHSESKASVSLNRLFDLYRLGSGDGVVRAFELRQHRKGTIWVATSSGLYQLSQSGGRWTSKLVDLATPGRAANNIRVIDLYEDHNGAMWAGSTGNGLYRIRPDGGTEHFRVQSSLIKLLRDSSNAGTAGTMLEDRMGRVWLGTDHGLAMLRWLGDSGQPQVARIFAVKDGLRDNVVEAMLETADGTLWVGTDTGLSEFCPASRCGQDRFRSSFSPSLGHTGAWTLAEDKDGNVWMGNETGATRIARDGFTAFDESDGLGSSNVYSISEDSSGELYVATGGLGRAYINRWEEGRFRAVAPRLPKHTYSPVSSAHQPVLQDHTGEWWVATERGFFRYGRVKRFEDLAHALPVAIYTTRSGLPTEQIADLYEDSKGDVWIASRSNSGHKGRLTRWQRSTGTFHIFSSEDGLTTTSWPMAFCEDRSGNLWVGLMDHDVARYRAGHFTVFTVKDGAPAGAVMRLYLDHAGRLWVATMDTGVARVDLPDAEHPEFVKYTSAEGLSSNQVDAVTEDQWGRIYLLTDSSVDRLDPLTGSIKRYRSADSPLSSHGGVAFRDRHGALWFGTLQGLSRLIPKTDQVAAPPPIRINAIRVRGEPLTTSELGETKIKNLMLQANQNQIEVEFASFSFSAGEQVRYQYRLDGANQDWSAVSDRRSVNYATLPAGRYRFRVRAVNWRGLVSAEPAEMEFQVLPPLWRRWWVQGLLGALVLSGSYALYRLRVGQLLELERVRTRIATDLHDDIGSSLTQISILSEVARREVGQNGQPAAEPLARIAELSRELVDSMSDIVWAVNPRRDRISDLEHRMRRFASDVLSARNIAFGFHTSDDNSDRGLRTDKRREVFLVFKEGVNNIVRHSQCKNVTIELRVERGHLLLRLCDDGTGFDPARLSGDEHHPGHGMQSMMERAKSVGAELTVDSKHGQGTILAMRIPL